MKQPADKMSSFWGLANESTDE